MRQIFGEHVHIMHPKLLGTSRLRVEGEKILFQNELSMLVSLARFKWKKKFVIEFLLDVFILRLIEEEEGRKKLARTHYSDAVAKVDEEIIKEEEAAKNKNQEVNDVQGELEEEDNAQ
ncbi:unnamed protein product [Brassica oleracea]